MQSNEAEAVKLFANTYLAMRVAFFNELDTFAFSKDLNTKQIIEGVCQDSRISVGYNNPSFGYGGYCLPKDSKQLLANYEQIPQKLITAIVDSNLSRAEFITHELLKQDPNVIGIYRLIMKEGSENFRSAAIFNIIDKIKENNIDIIIYEPLIDDSYYDGYEICNNLEIFKAKSDLVLANRISDEIVDINNKIFSRDVYGKD